MFLQSPSPIAKGFRLATYEGAGKFSHDHISKTNEVLRREDLSKHISKVEFGVHVFRLDNVLVAKSVYPILAHINMLEFGACDAILHKSFSSSIVNLEDSRLWKWKSKFIRYVG